MARFKETRLLYSKLVEAFRDRPGNYAYAAQRVGIGREAANRAWNLGWSGKEWAPPIRDQFDVSKWAVDEAEIHAVANTVESMSIKERIAQRRREYEEAFWEKKRKRGAEREPTEVVSYKQDPRVLLVADVLRAQEQPLDPKAVERDVATVRILDILATREASVTGAVALEQLRKLSDSVKHLRRALNKGITKLCADEAVEPERIVALLDRLLQLQAKAVAGYRESRELARLCLGEEAPTGADDSLPEMTPEEAIRITRAASAAAERAYKQMQAQKQEREEAERAAMARPVTPSEQEED